MHIYTRSDFTGVGGEIPGHVYLRIYIHRQRCACTVHRAFMHTVHKVNLDLQKWMEDIDMNSRLPPVVYL